MSRFLKRVVADESGATAIEYGLIAAMTTLQGKISGAFDKVGTAMPQ